MPISDDAQSDDPAVQAWRAVMALAGFGRGRRPRVPRVADELGMSPKQMVLLWRLPPGKTLTMGEIGQRLHCDASFVTGLVDRLEEDGLIERRHDERDRRVTPIALTPAGEKARERALELLYEPPPEFAALDPTELEQLAVLLQKAVPPATPGAAAESKP
jgi:DNA-binding MarR family transcriptional regulator